MTSPLPPFLSPHLSPFSSPNWHPATKRFHPCLPVSFSATISFWLSVTLCRVLVILPIHSHGRHGAWCVSALFRGGGEAHSASSIRSEWQGQCTEHVVSISRGRRGTSCSKVVASQAVALIAAVCACLCVTVFPTMHCHARSAQEMA